jgi:hypothetical protein
MHPDAPYFSIWLCLTPNDLLVKWIVLPLNGLTNKLPMYSLNYLSGNAT